MKKILIACCVLGGCATTDMAIMTGNLDSGLDYMNGVGQLSQGADGKQRFTYSVPVEGSQILGVESNARTRTRLLENWLGNEKACTKGYVVDSRQIVAEAKVEVIEGRCR